MAVAERSNSAEQFKCACVVYGRTRNQSWRLAGALPGSIGRKTRDWGLFNIPRVCHSHDSVSGIQNAISYNNNPSSLFRQKPQRMQAFVQDIRYS